MADMIRLGDVATYINGFPFKPEDRGNVGLPIIRIQDLTGNAYDLGFYDGKYPPRIEINDGDILISWSGSLGVYVWKRGKALLNQHIFKVVFDKATINKNYYVFAVRYKLREMENMTHGATMKHIVKGDFDNTLIPFPSLSQQEDIARILLSVASAIERRNCQLRALDQLIKARFVEMFGDFKTNPKGWPIVGFEEIATIDGNMTTDYERYADYPHIGIDSIEKDTGILRGYRTVAEDGVISGKYVFTPEHIIYSKIRPNLNKVALPDFVGLCSADAYPILPIPGKCNRVFLAYNMRSTFFLDYILQFCNRTNLPKVNRKEVSGFRTPLPPLALQNEFATFVSQVDKSKLSIQASLDQLETLKQSLMQKYFG